VGAIGNLLDNARKFSPPNATVLIRVVHHDDQVVVEVEDHGIGVPDAEKPHVFERFFRGADARVRETRGAGIGLALVEHAARAHGGRVEVADTAGGGATFRIVLLARRMGDRWANACWSWRTRRTSRWGFVSISRPRAST